MEHWSLLFSFLPHGLSIRFTSTYPLCLQLYFLSPTLCLVFCFSILRISVFLSVWLCVCLSVCLLSLSDYMSFFPLFLSVGLTSKTLTDYLLDTLPVYLSFLSVCVLFIEVSCKSFLFASFPNYWFYLSVYLSVYPLCLSSIGISAYLSHMCTMHMC